MRYVEEGLTLLINIALLHRELISATRPRHTFGAYKFLVAHITH